MGNTSGLAIASLVLGIIGIVLAWVPILNILLAITALILGIVALNKIKLDNTLEGKGMAIAGIVLGSVSIVFSLFILIGAIAYFGVLNPNTIIPERCTMSTGFTCDDYEVGDDGFAFSFGNGFGKGITISDIKLTGSSGESCADKPDLTVGNGDSGSVTIECATSKFAEGGRVKAMIEVTYYYVDSSPEFSHVARGELMTKI